MSASLSTLSALPAVRPDESRRRPAGRTITVRAAPRREPPFDDELTPAHAHHPSRRAGPGEQPLPFEQWPARNVARPSMLLALPAGRGDLPDPGSWARRLLVALLETRAGLRPLRQLSVYLSPSVHSGLTCSLARVPIASAGYRQAAVTSVHVSEPAAGVAEVSAVICTGERYRAIAARLEAVDGRWRCVRLQVG